MSKFSFSRCCLLGLLLCFWVAGASAQELAPPPLPDFATAPPPPPDPASLEPPPPLEWAPLPAPAAVEDSGVDLRPEELVVLPPQPEASLTPPPAAELASFVPGESGPATEDQPPTKGVEFWRDGSQFPEIEVWRDESQSPQMPVGQGPQFDNAYVTGVQPVLVRLRFDPVAAGKTVIVNPGPGVTVYPAETEFQVGPTGECVVSVMMDESYFRSELNFYYDGIRTRLPLSRATLTVVEDQEALTAEGAQ